MPGSRRKLLVTKGGDDAVCWRAILFESGGGVRRLRRRERRKMRRAAVRVTMRAARRREILRTRRRRCIGLRLMLRRLCHRIPGERRGDLWHGCIEVPWAGLLVDRLVHWHRSRRRMFLGDHRDLVDFLRGELE